MCRSKADGGQRCYSHAQRRVRTAQQNLERSPHDPQALAALTEAYVELASTSRGQADMAEQAARGADGPGGLPTWQWARLADLGAALRDRNAALASIGETHTDASNVAAATEAAVEAAFNAGRTRMDEPFRGYYEPDTGVYVRAAWEPGTCDGCGTSTLCDENGLCTECVESGVPASTLV